MVAAVNADGIYGKWFYTICRKPEDVTGDHGISAESGGGIRFNSQGQIVHRNWVGGTIPKITVEKTVHPNAGLCYGRLISMLTHSDVRHLILTNKWDPRGHAFTLSYIHGEI